MKLSFYTAPMLKFGIFIFYKYEISSDEKYDIKKFYFDQPLCLNDMLIENQLLNLDIEKSFDSELLLKNWLIDHNYKRVGNCNDYEVYKIELNQYCNSKINKVDFYAIWEDKGLK